MNAQHCRSIVILPLILAVLSLSAANVIAQTTAARPDRGTMPNGSYAVSDIENISLQNGNVNLNIPLASLPPIAGGKLSWGLNAQYNSKIWDVIRTQAIGHDSQNAPHYYVIDSPQPSDRGGWRITGQYQLEIRDAHDDFNYQLPPVADQDYPLMVNYNWYKVLLVMPDGSEHELRPLDYSPFPGGKEYMYGYYKETPYTNGAMRYYSYDGSYLFATITAADNWIVYLPDGTRITQASGIQKIQDTNGNKIKIFTDSLGTHYQDELTGREIRYVYDPAGNNNNGQGRVYYKTVGGDELHIDINFGTTSVLGKLYTVNDWQPGQLSAQPCTRQALVPSPLQVVREIVLPQTEPSQPARRFSFTYNSDTTETATDNARFSCSASVQPYTRTVSKGWGSLSQVVTPLGAEIQYSYNLDSGSLEANKVFSPDDISGETITKKTIVQDGAVDTWTYVILDNGGTQTYLPDNSVVEETKYPQGTAMGTGFGGPWFSLSGLVYRTVRPFSKTERHWTNLRFAGASNTSPGGSLTFNAVVDAEYTTLTDAAGNALKMSAKTMQYDYNGNVTQTTEYDWFDPASVSRDSYGIPLGVPSGATVLRVSNANYYNPAPSDTSANVYAKRSSSTGTPLILNALQETTVGPSDVQFSYDEQAWGVAPTVGNLTARKIWDNLDAKWITTSNTYDVYGNVLTATDGRGKITTFTYGDSTHALPTSVSVDPQNGTGVQTTSTIYDVSTGLVTSQTDVNGQTSTIDYTNQLLGTEDPFGRPGVTESPDIGTNQRHRVTSTYIDSARQVIIESDLNAQNDKLLKTRTTTDQLGRPTLTEQTEDGANYTISVRNAYLDMGRVTLTSSAMRSTAASTDSWTRVTKDVTGRVIEVATFGGATQPAWSGTSGVFTGLVTTSYDAQFTTVTDQAGKVRRSMVDALGRLIRVDEPDANGSLGSTGSPTQRTDYTYDVLGDLTTVTQPYTDPVTPVTQTRTFTYDSLSRLRTAVNPESGTITYQYDDNGNLVVKTDARNVSTHFEYDALNRLTRRWYNGSNSVSALTHNNPTLPTDVGTTNEARFYYDTQTLPSGAPSYSHGLTVGRMVAQVYGSGSNGDYYAYDALGRQTLKVQQTGTVNYQVSASYTLSGAVVALTYPSGNVVTHSYDQAGRLTALSGNLGTGGSARTYATGILYSPLGGLVKEQFGTNTAVYNKLFYNSRGQLAEVRASTSYTGPTDYDANRGAIVNSYSDQCTGICSGSSMSDNNGNLKRQDIYIPNEQTRAQQYVYDSLNRLQSARELIGTSEQWRQWFHYDRWGNRTIDNTVENGQSRTYGVGINNTAFTVNAATNQLGVPAGDSRHMDYDAAGNLTNDTYTGAGNRTYDGDNKITSAWGGNGQAQLYSYDASGQRIKRTVNGVETWQVYGLGGELVAEYPANGAAASPQKEYGYRDGQLLVTADVTPGMNGYTNQRTITIDHTKVPNTDQSNFPVLISGTFSYLATVANGGSVRNANGYDVIFTSDAGCLTKLDHEVDTYNATTGAVNYWVRVPLLSHTNDTTIYMCYGNAAITTDQSNKTGVWDSNFKAVYHLNDQAANTTVADSSANSSNGVNAANTSSKSTSGKVGQALNYNGSSDNTATGVTQTSSFTWECWFKLTDWTTQAGSSNYSTLMAGVWGNSGALLMLWKDSGWLVEFAVDNAGGAIQSGTNSIAPGSWHHAAFTRTGNSGTYALYLDGVWKGQDGSGTNNTNTTISLGTRSDYTSQALNGLLDEARISNTARSADWIKTEYNNQSSPATFYSISAATTGSTTTNSWLITDQLGTPRMILDQTGSLSGIKRHDYLPFGEDLFGGTDASPGPGGRKPSLGYGCNPSDPNCTPDRIRQQFTQKERDVETGLDYFEARYYSSRQGRFTSSDEFSGGPDDLYDFADDASDNPTFYADLMEPQSLNKYQYAFNNPLRFVDPDGHDAVGQEPQGQQPVPRPYGFQPYDPQRQKEKLDGSEAQFKCQQGDCSGVNKMIPPVPIPPLLPLPAPINSQAQSSPEASKRNHRRAARRPAPQRRTRSPHRIGRRFRFNTKKAAEEAARQAGKGNAPVNHPNDKWGPHFHPGDGNGKPLNHDHYYYPRPRGTPRSVPVRRPPGKYSSEGP